MSNRRMLSQDQLEECDTQEQTILMHLRQFRTITADEGKKKYSIENTKGRISDLRKRPDVVIETIGGRPGVTTTYRLVPQQEQQEELFETEGETARGRH